MADPLRTAELSGVAASLPAAPEGGSLGSNVVWAFLGNLVYALCQWGMLVVLARLGNPAMVGRFILGLAIATPVLMFTNMQLRAVLATDAAHQYAFGQYLGLRMLTTLAALPLILLIALAGGHPLETVLVIWVVALARAVESFGDVLYGLFQLHEHLGWIARSMVLRGLLSLLAMTGALYLTRSLVWYVAGMALVWLLVLVSHDMPCGVRLLSQLGLGSHLRPEWGREPQMSLIHLALPLGVVMTMISLNTNVPRYFVQGHLGDGSLGVFAALAYLATGLTALTDALGHSATPRLARSYAAGETAAFQRLLLKLLTVGVTLSLSGLLIALVAGEGILAFFYGHEYAGYRDLLVWLMGAASVGCIGSLLTFGMTSARKFQAQLPMFTLVLATAAAGCHFLIPIAGLQGAAAAMLIAAVVQAVYAAISIGLLLHPIHGCRPVVAKEA